MSSQLTFFCELSGAELLALILQRDVIKNLQQLDARVSLAMLDLSSERRDAIALLHDAGISLVAWLVLDPEQGYWLNVDNVESARARYSELTRWLQRNQLSFSTIGLDVEPPIEDAMALMRRGTRGLWEMLRRRRSHAHHQAAQRRYTDLVAQMRHDGYFVETYQFPLVVDERASNSSLLQRALGFVDIEADREVLMLYRSLIPAPLSDALVDSYGPEAGGIAVGITGGGVQFVLQALGSRLLAYHQLVVDLRRARRYTDHLYVFSLEGCVRRGYLARLGEANLEPALIPSSGLFAGRVVRRSGQLLLQGAAHYSRLKRLAG
jgi:hypothetical protein